MLDLFKERRTIRKYKDQIIEEEKIDQLLEAALTAPSGRNSKPVEIIVIEEKDTLEQLSKLRGRSSQWIKDAPLGLAIIFDPEKTTTGLSDSAIVATILQLQAKSLGLGSCWIHVESRQTEAGEDVETKVQNILDIPRDYRVNSLLSIGYPDEKKSPYKYEDLDFTKIHYEKF